MGWFWTAGQTHLKMSALALDFEMEDFHIFLTFHRQNDENQIGNSNNCSFPLCTHVTAGFSNSSADQLSLWM